MLNDLKTIGSIIQKLMVSHQITQEQFAEAFDADPRTIRRWIRNGVNKLDLIDEIAKFFEIEAKDILLK